MSNYIELLNPGRKWTIGKGNQLISVDISDTLTINNKAIVKDISINGVFDALTGRLDSLTIYDSINIVGDTSFNKQIEIYNNDANNEDGYIYAPSNLIIDPKSHGDDTGKVTIKGNLDVQGETTTITSNTIDLGDNIIVLNTNGTTNTEAGIEISYNDSDITTNPKFIFDATNNINKWSTKGIDIITNISGSSSLLNHLSPEYYLKWAQYINRDTADASFHNLDISGNATFKGDITCNTLKYNTLDPEIITIKDTITIKILDLNLNETSSEKHFEFEPDIYNENYTFIRGNKYIFDCSNIGPYSFYVSDKGANQDSDELIFGGDKSFVTGISGDSSFSIIIPSNYSKESFTGYIITGTTTTSITASFRVSDNNIFYKNEFSDISFITDSSSVQDLSNLFFEEIIPIKENNKVRVNINFTYFCSVGFSERISIYLYRYNVSDNEKLLYQDLSLGTFNATGGFTNNYTITLIDNPSYSGLNKYYIKYQIEDNLSKIPQGIYNLGTNSIHGSAYIILEEINCN